MYAQILIQAFLSSGNISVEASQVSIEIDNHNNTDIPENSDGIFMSLKPKGKPMMRKLKIHNVTIFLLKRNTSQRYLL